MVNLYIIDDHALIISGLKTSFRSPADFIKITGFSMTIGEALESIPQRRVDIILLDLFLPETEPLANIKTLSKSFPHIPIVIISMESSLVWKSRAFQVKNVKAFLSKNDDISYMKNIISMVATGKTIIPEEVNYFQREEIQSGQNGFNPREVEVIRNIASGYSLKEIAMIHNRSVSAIEKSLLRMRLKAGARNNPQLVKLFFLGDISQEKCYQHRAWEH